MIYVSGLRVTCAPRFGSNDIIIVLGSKILQVWASMKFLITGHTKLVVSIGISYLLYKAL